MASESPQAYDPLEASLAIDPQTQLQRVFVYFLQILFRDYPPGCGMRWTDNEETTEMIITAEKPDVSAIEKRPHIVCVLGGSRWSGLGLDQMQATQMGTGERTHTDLVSSTMAYHCQAKEGLVARRIAWNASFYTNVFRRILQREGGLHQVSPNHNVGPESPPSAITGQLVDEEAVEVIATVPFFWQPQWLIRPPAEVWRRMKMTMAAKGSPIVSAARQSQLKSPTIKGRPVYPVQEDRPGVEQEVRADSYPR